MVSFVLVIVFIAVGLVFFSLIGLLIIEVIKFNRVGVRAYFIHNDKTIKRKKYKNVKEKIHFDELDYEYDDTKSFWKGRRKEIYYIYGNPKPIEIGVKNNSEFSVEDYKNILRSDIIKKLFDEDGGLSKESMLLLGVIAVGFLILAFMVWKLSSNPVILDPTNTQYLKEVIVDAIKNGV